MGTKAEQLITEAIAQLQAGNPSRVNSIVVTHLQDALLWVRHGDTINTTTGAAPVAKAS